METSGNLLSGEVPDAAQWISPLSWGGTPLRAQPTDGLEYPASALFVRASLIYTIAKTIGPGMVSETQRSAPGLIRLEKGKAVEVHTQGIDGFCWTFRLKGRGRTARWVLCVGESHPAREESQQTLMEAHGIQYVVVQTLLPSAQTHRHVAFRIRGDMRMEDFSKLAEKDAD